jgi:crotonobetainyl-CoA:carnitine CoA-transferase CaiB-like acyl-CoA transferase
MAALMARDVTGEGQQVDVSIQEACAFVSRAYVREAGGDTDARSMGGMHADDAAFPCADGRYVLPLAPFSTPAQWAALIEWFRHEGVGEPLWELDLERLEAMTAANGGRVPALPGFRDAVMQLGLTRASSELIAVPQSLGFTWVVYNTPDELLEDEQLQHRHFFRAVRHPEHGMSYTYAGEPYKFALGGWDIRRRPPLLGEHDQVLDELLLRDVR